MTDFKRLHCYPRAVFKGADLYELTVRGQWLLDRSKARYLRRPDAYTGGPELHSGEIGTFESFRFILD